MKNPLTPLVDLLVPPKCIVCGRVMTNPSDYVCPLCLVELPRVPTEVKTHNCVYERLRCPAELARAEAAYIFKRDNQVADIIHRFKYYQMPGLARAMGRHIAREYLLNTDLFTGVTHIIPVPMHPLKLLRRGYNQARLLARGVSEVTGIPLANNLRAVRGHKTQTHKSVEQRAANLKGVFGVSHPEQLHSAYVLLVDDVCTTGATLREAVVTLKQAQPNCYIAVLTMAAVI